MARRRSQRVRGATPLVYIALALLMAAFTLPSALRPPPEQTSESAALSADAPEDELQDQVIQAIDQASGSGAGAEVDEAATTTTVPATPTTLAPAAGECFGEPRRQNFSVYAPGCAPAFAGDNGGATYKNVFPDEIRIGWFHGFGAPSAGRLEETPQEDDTPSDRTFRVFAQWFNEHYQLWGRKIVFYGVDGGGEPEEDQAAVRQAVDEYKLFTASHPNIVFCDEFAAEMLPMWCVAVPRDTFQANDGRVFSYPMELTKVSENGAEYVCKRLFGRPPKFAGADVAIAPVRRIAYTTTVGTALGGAPMRDFVQPYERQCGEAPVKTYQFGADADFGAEQLAVREMFEAGVTTIVTSGELYSVLYLMQAADALGWHPEWVVLANWGADNNTAAKLFPPGQMQHTFGLSNWEVPQRPHQTECYRAYHEIDPANDPAPLHCAFWQQLVLMMAGFQNAGPELTAESYRDGLYELGYRCGLALWMSCGAIAPNDNSYTDDLAEIWWDASAVAPDDGAPGAYWYTHNGTRHGLGEWTDDDSGLFNKERSILEPPP